MEAMIVSGSEQPMGRSGFDYDQYKGEAWIGVAWQEAQEIRWHADTAVQSIIEIGKRLIRVKSAMPEGYWTQWLEEEFAWSRVYAQKLMRIARSFGDMNLEGVTTAVTALEITSLASLPSSVLSEARTRLAQGELTMPQAREIVRTVDPDLADTFQNGQYWSRRRKKEAQQIMSHAAEFQAAVRNLQICLAEVYDPIHPRVKRAVDQLTGLIAVIMDVEDTQKLQIGPQRRRRRADANSKYHGVSWNKADGKWHATFYMPGANRKRIYLGVFDTEEAAARAYDTKAKELYGDKARLNFPDE